MIIADSHGAQLLGSRSRRNVCNLWDKNNWM